MFAVTFKDFQTFLWLDRTTPKMSKEALKYIFERLKNNRQFYALTDIIENWNFKEVSKEDIQGDFGEYIEHLQKNGWVKATTRGAVYQTAVIPESDFSTSQTRRAEKRKELQEQYAQKTENSNNN
ncbi:MAG: hypothetical protein FWF51_09790 [Chitinivibrionia bacterium]|nr:hypothetical protein [Chitinivibrionia bacterium]